MEYLFEYKDGDVASDYVIACFNRSLHFNLPMIGGNKLVYGIRDGVPFYRDKKEDDNFSKVSDFIIEAQKLANIKE
ncbi:hypothetical protein [Niabella aurantiaca]|uniref:hypothetical protein n=1 Tax=Niabella aurantiaca TaxID=379900 RepID=UPI000593A6D5|nr:hypothetical protein [Niabella aurantiaca]